MLSGNDLLRMFKHQKRSAQHGNDPLQHEQALSRDVSLRRDGIDAGLDELCNRRDMRLDESQSRQLVLKRSERRQSLVRHRIPPHIDVLPDFIGGCGDFPEQSAGESFHLFPQSGFQYGVPLAVFRQRRDSVQLPGEREAGPDILGTYRGLPDDAGPFGMLVDPVFNGLVIIGKEGFLFPEEIIPYGT